MKFNVTKTVVVEETINVTAEQMALIVGVVMDEYTQHSGFRSEEDAAKEVPNMTDDELSMGGFAWNVGREKEMEALEDAGFVSLMDNEGNGKWDDMVVTLTDTGIQVLRQILA